MNYSAQQIAFLVKGKIEGNPEVAVSAFGKIEEAKAGELSFLANPKYEEYLYTSGASIILINESLNVKQKISATLIRVPDAYSAFALLLTTYQETMVAQMTGVQEPAYIHATAQLGEKIFIGAFCYVGEQVKIGNNVKVYPNGFIGNHVKIGNNCIFHPGVKIYQDCVIGDNVIIHAGTVIGSDGFGFAPQPDGSYKKIPQLGNVVIEDDVEIGANTTIDRATMGSTRIKKGAKLDNLIQVAHNVEIGCNVVMAAQSGVSGSTKIGNSAMIGGQAGIVGHLQIGEGTKITAQSGVTKSTKLNAIITGSPAQDNISALRSQALFRNLPELERRIQKLENLIKQLQAEKV